VAVLMGAAFGAVITALVKDLITPLIAAIVGQPDFSAITFTINNSKFLVGDFINAVISFLLIATAVYFFVVVPVNRILARMRRGDAPVDPTTRKCPECLSDVPSRQDNLLTGFLAISAFTAAMVKRYCQPRDSI
jgi:large conductance mechanosensitive channel